MNFLPTKLVSLFRSSRPGGRLRAAREMDIITCRSAEKTTCPLCRRSCRSLFASSCSSCSCSTYSSFSTAFVWLPICRCALAYLAYLLAEVGLYWLFQHIDRQTDRQTNWLTLFSHNILFCIRQSNLVAEQLIDNSFSVFICPVPRPLRRCRWSLVSHRSSSSWRPPLVIIHPLPHPHPPVPPQLKQSDIANDVHCVCSVQLYTIDFYVCSTTPVALLLVLFRALRTAGIWRKHFTRNVGTIRND